MGLQGEVLEHLKVKGENNGLRMTFKQELAQWDYFSIIVHQAVSFKGS